MVIDIQVRQQLQSLFRSEADRLRNADFPDQIRPKEKVKRYPLKGLARMLYLDRKVKLSKAETVATSGVGLGTMKAPVTKKQKKNKKDEPSEK